MTEFCALLLAAGDSSRFGLDKRFVGSPPLLEQTLQSLYGVYQQIIVVHKHDDDLSSISINSDCVTLVPHNKREDDSLGASIAVGIDHILQSYLTPSFCAIFLADMPYINYSTIIELHNQCVSVQSSPSDKRCILRPAFNKTQGHPVIFSSHFFTLLSQLKACDGARNVIKQNESNYVEVPVSDKGVITDIDTLETAKKLGLVVN